MEEKLARALLAAFGFGLVVGVAAGILLAPPGPVRVVRFVDLPPAPDQCDREALPAVELQ